MRSSQRKRRARESNGTVGARELRRLQKPVGASFALLRRPRGHRRRKVTGRGIAQRGSSALTRRAGGDGRKGAMARVRELNVIARELLRSKGRGPIRWKASWASGLHPPNPRMRSGVLARQDVGSFGSNQSADANAGSGDLRQRCRATEDVRDGGSSVGLLQPKGAGGRVANEGA